MAEAMEEGEETSKPEERERGTDEGGDDGEEREKSKWDMVVELVYIELQDRVLDEEANQWS